MFLIGPTIFLQPTDGCIFLHSWNFELKYQLMSQKQTPIWTFSQERKKSQAIWNNQNSFHILKISNMNKFVSSMTGLVNKSCIQETLNILTIGDSSTNTMGMWIYFFNFIYIFIFLVGSTKFRWSTKIEWGIFFARVKTLAF